MFCLLVMVDYGRIFVIEAFGHVCPVLRWSYTSGWGHTTVRASIGSSVRLDGRNSTACRAILIIKVTDTISQGGPSGARNVTLLALPFMVYTIIETEPSLLFVF